MDRPGTLTSGPAGEESEAPPAVQQSKAAARGSTEADRQAEAGRPLSEGLSGCTQVLLVGRLENHAGNREGPYAGWWQESQPSHTTVRVPPRGLLWTAASAVLSDPHLSPHGSEPPTAGPGWKSCKLCGAGEKRKHFPLPGVLRAPAPHHDIGGPQRGWIPGAKTIKATSAHHTPATQAPVGHSGMSRSLQVQRASR